MAAFTVIDHTELSSAASSWSVSSIPSTYDHLLIKGQERNSSGGAGRYPQLRLGNSSIDTGSNYSATYLFTRTSTPSSGRSSSYSFIPLYYGADDNNTANTFSSFSIWIPHYANTSNYKQAILEIVGPSNSTSNYDWGMGMLAGLWQSQSAITNVQILAWSQGSNNHMQYSTFTLYGITNNA